MKTKPLTQNTNYTNKTKYFQGIKKTIIPKKNNNIITNFHFSFRVNKKSKNLIQNI